MVNNTALAKKAEVCWGGMPGGGGGGGCIMVGKVGVFVFVDLFCVKKVRFFYMKIRIFVD